MCCKQKIITIKQPIWSDTCDKSKEGEGKENSLSHGGRWKISRIKQRDLFHDCIQQRGIAEEWLQSVSIDIKALSCGLTFDFNYPIRINVSNNKRSNPFRTKLTTHESEPRIIQQNSCCPTMKSFLAIKLSWNFLVFSL